MRGNSAFRKRRYWLLKLANVYPGCAGALNLQLFLTVFHRIGRNILPRTFAAMEAVNFVKRWVRQIGVMLAVGCLTACHASKVEDSPGNEFAAPTLEEIGRAHV